MAIVSTSQSVQSVTIVYQLLSLDFQALDTSKRLSYTNRSQHNYSFLLSNYIHKFQMVDPRCANIIHHAYLVRQLSLSFQLSLMVVFVYFKRSLLFYRASYIVHHVTWQVQSRDSLQADIRPSGYSYSGPPTSNYQHHTTRYVTLVNNTVTKSNK